MLLSLAVVLGILWAMGLLVVYISNPILHLVLVIAVIVVVFDLFTRRSRN